MGDYFASQRVGGVERTYNAVMPPMLQSDVTVSSVLSSMTVKRIPAIGALCKDLHCNSASSSRLGFGKCVPFTFGTMTSVSFLSKRRCEAPLYHREFQICDEYNRLRKAEETRQRGQEEETRHNDREIEQQPLIGTVKQLEELRAERKDEQWRRVLAQQRELEEWKYERAKELERERRRYIEEQERLRERQHERAMQLLREEAEIRLRGQHDVSACRQVVEQVVKSATNEVLEQIRDEIHERGCDQRGEISQLQQSYRSEVMLLRQDMDSERRMFSRTEQQIAATQEKLSLIVNQLKEVRQKQNGCSKSRTSEEALVDVHRKTVEALQRTFEEDKLNMKRWFDDELRRINNAHEKMRCEEEDKYNSQLKLFERTIEQQQQRQQEVESELQQWKTRAAVAATAASEEEHLREELRVSQKHLKDALATHQRLERRAADAERATNAARSALHTLHTELETLSTKQVSELRLMREEKQQLVDELARCRLAYEEEMQRAHGGICSGENIASHGLSGDFQLVYRRMKERHEEAFQALEKEKVQLEQRLRDAEKQLEVTKQQVVQQHEKIEEVRREGEQHWGLLLSQKDCTINELQGTVDELTHDKHSAAQIATENLELKQQVERQRLEFETLLQSRDCDIQRLRQERQDALQRVEGIHEELGTSQRMWEGEEYRLRLLVEEAENREKDLRREIEDARKSAQSWRDHSAKLQAEAAAALSAGNGNMEALLREKNCEIEKAKDALELQTREKESLQQQLWAASEVRTSMEKELMDKQTMIVDLNSQIASLKHAVQMKCIPPETSTSSPLSLPCTVGVEPLTGPTRVRGRLRPSLSPPQSPEATTVKNSVKVGVSPVCAPVVTPHPFQPLVPSLIPTTHTNLSVPQIPVPILPTAGPEPVPIAPAPVNRLSTSAPATEPQRCLLTCPSEVSASLIGVSGLLSPALPVPAQRSACDDAVTEVHSSVRLGCLPLPVPPPTTTVPVPQASGVVGSVLAPASMPEVTTTNIESMSEAKVNLSVPVVVPAV